MRNENNGTVRINRVTWIIAAVLVIIVIAAVIVDIITANVEMLEPAETTCSSEQMSSRPTEFEVQTEATISTEETTELSTDMTQETVPVTAPTVTPTLPAPTDPPKTVIHLPYTIPGTTLEIHKVANYTGVYLEDGSNSDISDVAMMLIYNSGSEAVEFADCKLIYDDKTLEFKLSALPAGARVAVQEVNGQSCAKGDLTACGVDIATMPVLEMSEDQVSVVDNGDNTLTITNLTEQDIPTVRVFYKYYLEDEDAFIGGITFNAAVVDLKAGESMLLTTKRFTSNSCLIIMVRTYDTLA